LAQPQLQKRARRQNATQLLFLSCLEAGTQVPLVTVSCPSLRTAAPPPHLPPYKRLKEDARLFGFWLFGGGKLFGCGRLLEGRIAGGRLPKEEKELLKGKELLMENC
jgi:hypothetical protein